MKKLMTVIAAVAAAFGLYAEDPAPAATSYAISFEEADGCTQGGALNNEAWTVPEGATATVVEKTLNYGYDVKPGDERRDLFNGSDNFNSLKLETGKGTVVCTTGVAGDVFFDQVVKFTGYEEDPEVTEGKIAVYMTAIETEGTEGEEGYKPGETNLYITCGRIDALGEITKIEKIDLGPADIDATHRVTIKSLGKIAKDTNIAGFLVYIDGEQVKIDAAKGIIDADQVVADFAAQNAEGSLFPALAEGAVEAKVAYQGIGELDDVAVDALGPVFARYADVSFAPLTGATIAKVVDAAGTEFLAPAGVIKVKEGELTVYLAAKDGWILKVTDPKTVDTADAVGGVITVTLDEGDVVEAVAKIGDDLYENLTETLAAVQELEKTYDEIEVSILKDCDEEIEAAEVTVGFAAESTIVIAKGGIWAVEGDTLFIGNIGEAGLAKAVTVDGNLAYAGTIAAGSSIVATTIDTTLEDQAIVLEADASITTTTDISAIVSAAEELPAGYKLKPFTLEDDYTKWAVVKDGGFMVIIAGQDPQYYETLEDAIGAAEDGATIKLLKNGAAAAKVDVVNDITVDLNGFTLRAATDTSSLFVIKDATLTINGTTEGSALVGRLNVGESVYAGGVRTAHWDGALVINGGDYSVGNGQTVIHVNGDCEAAAVTINDATITSPTDNGVQFNGKGTFAINNSTITGATAVYMKAGTLAIDEDSEIVATAANWTAPVENHNGSNPTGDAIVMDSITGYKGAISLTVADGATVTKVAEGAATIRETITAGANSTTVKIDAPSIAGIALTPQFIAMVAAGTAQLPGYVAVIGTVPYKTLQAAITAAGEDATVKLIANAEENVTIAAGKDITLDLNGKTLTGATATYAIVNYGVVTIKGGTVQNKVTNHNSLICNKPVGRMTIENGTFICDRITIKNDEDGKGVYGTLVINGGTFTASQEADTDLVWDAVQNWGDAQINGGTFDGYIECRAESTWNAGVMEINGGTFNKPVQTVVVFDAQKAPAENAADVALTIKGGTFNDMVMRVADVKAKAGEAANVRVDFDENMPEYVAACDTLGTITIAGLVEEELNDAQFKNDESVYCETGYETVKLDSAQYYTVAVKAPEPEVAKIDTKTYPTLAAAFEDAKGDESVTIELLGDLTEDVNVTGVNATLDLGGFTLTGAMSVAGTLTIANGTNHFVNADFAITGGKLTLAADAVLTGWYSNESIKITNGADFDIYGKILIDDANHGNAAMAVVIMDTSDGSVVNAYEGCYIESGVTIFKSRCGGDNSDTEVGTINVYGGTFTQTSSYGSMFYGSKKGYTTFNIVGGTFNMVNGGSMFYSVTGANNTITGLDGNCTAKFSKDPLESSGYAKGNPIAEGYGAVEGDDGYYMIKKVWDVTLINGEIQVDKQVVADGACATNVTLAVDGFKGWTNETYTAGFDFATQIKADLTLYAWIEAAQPVNPEEPKQYNTPEEAADAAKAINDSKETMIITPPDAVAADYTKLFTAVVTADNKVVVELNVDGTNTLAQSAEKVVEKATGLGDSTATAVTITPAATDIVPGFYYGLGASTEVAGEKVVTSWQQATTEGLKEPLTANKPENSTKGFFQVRVSVRQQN